MIKIQNRLDPIGNPPTLCHTTLNTPKQYNKQKLELAYNNYLTLEND